MQQPTPHTVSLLGNSDFVPGVEHEIEGKAREVAIYKGFSCADQVRYVHPSLCYIDFPHSDAANSFTEATNGILTLSGGTYKLHFASAVASETSARLAARDGDELIEDSTQPTDTLVVRHGGELPEATIREAFESFMPHIKSMKVPLNWAGKPKNIAFVRFHGMSEAQTALTRFQAAGSLIGNRRVVAAFAQPNTEEDMVRQSALKKAEDEQIQENTQQALSGINGDMWATYLDYFKGGGT